MQEALSPEELRKIDAPETPGSINEGGELGYALLHAYGAVFDNPDLLVCCVIGEEGTATTPFDMCVLNEIDRFHLAIDVIDPVERLAGSSAHPRQELQDKPIDHWRGVRAHGEDMPGIRDWHWLA
jgi:phosphoketolase